MSFLDQTFEADALPQSTGFEPLPAGWYDTTIQGAELKTTKAGNGQYIAVKYAITGPTHQGRIVFGNLNIKNPNPTAENIGRQQLGDLMRAIGLAKVTDTDQLVSGTLQIKLAINKNEQYGDSNDVKGFKSNGNAMPPVTATPPQETNKSNPPWKK